MSDLQAIISDGDELYTSCLDPADYVVDDDGGKRARSTLKETTV